MTITREQQEKRDDGRERIRVRVLFFGAAREIAGDGEVELEIHAPASASSAFEEIMASYPKLRRFGRSLLFAVNQEYARDSDREVRAGDELAIFPPVSGGAEEDDDEEDDQDKRFF